MSTIQEEEFLGSMLGECSELTMDIVRDVLFNCGYDVEDALNTLLEISSSCMDVPSHGKSCKSFIQALSGKTKTPTAESQLSEQVLASLFHMEKPKNAEQERLTMNLSNIERKMAAFGQGSYKTETMMFSSAKGEDYKVLRQGSTQRWKLMNSCFNKAASSFYYGDKFYASVMSDQARLHRNTARGLQEVASRDIFESRSRTIENVITIDLHGQSVDEAIRFLKLHLLFGVNVRSVQTFKVITGIGKLLKQSVVNLLQKENIQWREENRGMVIVNLSRETKLSSSFMSDQSLEYYSNRTVENVITIDLHGQHVSEGMRIVKLHLLFGVCLMSVQTLKVITGCGSHGSSKLTLKQSVVNLLQRENIRWEEENRGMLVVKLKGQTQLAFVESGRF